MQTDYKPSFLILLMLISFPSVNAVLYTPALPALADYFSVSSDMAQQTITIFLFGYTLGQLIYGPIANRFGRLPAVFVGVSIQVLSSLACVAAGRWHSFELFYVARFMAAMGSGVGLKITFTLVNEYYTPKVASQKISYLILAFAIAPGLAVSIGGVLTQFFDWVSCFYFLAAYGLLIFHLARKLPETKTILDLEAFEWKHLIGGYVAQFKNPQLIAAGLVMGSGCAIIYLFATLAPFIAIHTFGMSSAEYGFANFLPSLGMLMGSLLSALLLKRFAIIRVISFGIPLNWLGLSFIALGLFMGWHPVASLFIPAMVMLTGNALMYGNASTLGLQSTPDKAHGSAVMNFLNMGLGTLSVFSLSLHSFNPSIILPVMCACLCVLSFTSFMWIKRLQK